MKLFLYKPKESLLFILVSLACMVGRAQVTITPNQTFTALAQKLAGPGITVSNVSGTCATLANGFFSVTSSNLGLDSGIILTTGRASAASGPQSTNASFNNGLQGDADLTNIFNNIQTFDACKLEFDIIPRGDSVKFDYVFGSEEYASSVCAQYNDNFAFLISGPGIPAPYQNIALVPGTSVPVAVNSVNNGIPGSNAGSSGLAKCLAMGAGSPFTNYYVDNTTGTTITYRGFTKVLTAVHAVQPCSTYHLKLVIADGGNGTFDSGVFIKGSSLKASTYSATSAGLTGGGSTIPYIVKGCTPGTVTIKRSEKKGTPQTIKYLIAGTAVNGVDYSQISDSVVIPANDSLGVINIVGLLTTPQGQKSLKLFFLSPYSCNGQSIMDSASLLIEDGLQVAIKTADTTVCEATSFPLSVDGGSNYVYSWQPSAGLSNPNVKEPTVVATTNTDYLLTTTLPNSGCPPALDTFHVKVVPIPTVDAGANQSVCEGGSFTLTATVTPSGYPYWRTWVAPSGNGPSGYDADAITVNNAQPAYSGYYVITASSDICTSVSDSLLVTVKPNPAPPFVNTPLDLCFRQVPYFPLIKGKADYRWYTSETGGAGDTTAPEAPVASLGTYRYYVSVVSNGCEGGRSELVVNVDKCCADNFFIPDAFTPNGDGVNDRIRIVKAAEDKVMQFEIYNRWGQIVYSGIDDRGWDGSYHGTPLEAGTYYYQLTVGCDKGNIPQLVRKGSVTLVR